MTQSKRKFRFQTRVHFSLRRQGDDSSTNEDFARHSRHIPVKYLAGTLPCYQVEAGYTLAGKLNANEPDGQYSACLRFLPRGPNTS